MLRPYHRISSVPDIGFGAVFGIAYSREVKISGKIPEIHKIFVNLV